MKSYNEVNEAKKEQSVTLNKSGKKGSLVKTKEVRGRTLYLISVPYNKLPGEPKDAKPVYHSSWFNQDEFTFNNKK